MRFFRGGAHDDDVGPRLACDVRDDRGRMTGLETSSHGSFARLSSERAFLSAYSAFSLWYFASARPHSH